MHTPPNVIEQFVTLASINSPSREEGAVAEYLVSRLKEIGADDVRTDDSAEKTGSDTGNVLAAFSGTARNAPRILLCSHMDTIGETEGMRPVLRNGCIYSNGKTVLGADDKAGIAVILCAIQALQSQNIPFGDLQVVFTVQEEVGLIGAKNLDTELKADFGFILDGDGPVGTIIHRLSAKVNLDLVMTGKAAHAGICPEEGVNAVVAAATAISQLQSGRIDPETTSNFGKISGGKARNMVPDRAEITAEVRSLNPAKLDREVKAVLETFRKVSEAFNAPLTVRQETSYRSFTISERHPAVDLALRAAPKIGIAPCLASTGGGLDANVFNERGLTCVGLGLGIENAHSPQEYIPTAQLEAGVRFLVAILSAACDSIGKN